MTHDLQQKLKNRWRTFTASEQRIAAYLLQNLSGLPFETAASLGERVGVSAMTVGRFLRKLGYAGVGEMKEELRGDVGWLKLYRTPIPSDDADAAAESMQAEIQALSEAHALVKSEEWSAVVHLLTTADRVSVSSFQLGRFLGQAFATLLQQIRPRVTFASGTDGAYADLLIDSTEKSCVVLIEQRRYSRHFRILAEQVSARGIPLIIITDSQCYWARPLTPYVLMLPIRDDRPWHSFVGFSSLFSLLMNAVTRERGDAVYERIEQITGLRQQLVGYSGPNLGGRTHKVAEAKKASATPRSSVRNKRNRG